MAWSERFRERKADTPRLAEACPSDAVELDSHRGCGELASLANREAAQGQEAAGDQTRVGGRGHRQRRVEIEARAAAEGVEGNRGLVDQREFTADRHDRETRAGR